MSSQEYILGILESMEVRRGFLRSFLGDVKRILRGLVDVYVDGAPLPAPFDRTDAELYAQVLTVVRQLSEWERVGDDARRIDVPSEQGGRPRYRTWKEFADEVHDALASNLLVGAEDEGAYWQIVEYVGNVMHVESATVDIGQTDAARQRLANGFIAVMLDNVPAAGAEGQGDVGEGSAAAATEGNEVVEEAEGVPGGPVVQGHPVEAEGLLPSELESQASNVVSTASEAESVELSAVAEEDAMELSTVAEEMSIDEPSEGDVTMQSASVDESAAVEQVEAAVEQVEAAVEHVEAAVEQVEAAVEQESGEIYSAATVRRGVKRGRRDISYAEEASRAEEAKKHYNLRATRAREERLSRLREKASLTQDADASKSAAGSSAKRSRKESDSAARSSAKRSRKESDSAARSSAKRSRKESDSAAGSSAKRSRS